MKEIIKNNILSLTFIVIICFGLVFAGDVIVKDGNVEVGDDLNVSDVLFVNSTSGNVGVGTETPATILHLKGNLADLRIEDTGTNYATMRFFVNSLEKGSFRADNDGNFRFDTLTSEAFRITSDNDFGMGTISPNNRLEVVKDDAVADDITNIARLTHTTSGTVADGIGSGLLFSAERVGGSTWSGSKIAGVMESVSSPESMGLRFYTTTGGSIILKERMRIANTGEMGIGTTSPSYPLEVVGNVSGISIWSDANVSATGFITRTSVYDKSKGSALDFIKDADVLKVNGEIDHKRFYGYAGEFEVADYSRPETKEECRTEEGEEVCSNVTYYPYKKMEEGVSLDAEIDVLRQAVFELKERLDEVCEKDKSYSWC